MTQVILDMIPMIQMPGKDPGMIRMTLTAERVPALVQALTPMTPIGAWVMGMTLMIPIQERAQVLMIPTLGKVLDLAQALIPMILIEVVGMGMTQISLIQERA